MSYKEAVEDGLEMKKRGTYTIFYPSCRFCSNKVESYNYIRSCIYLCPICRSRKNILMKTGLLDDFSME